MKDELMQVGLFSCKVLWKLAKNTPKAVVAIANAKRKLTDKINDGLIESNKRMREDLLEDKIAKLKKKSKRKILKSL